MTAPRLQYERSLALHGAVAQKLHAHPEIIDRARGKLAEWIARGGDTVPLWRKWQKILDQTPEEIAAFLVDPSEEAAWLRKASPFSGALTPAERLRILKETRARLESAA